MKILLMGAHSFVASNIEKLVDKNIYTLHKFNRGIEKKEGDVIKGNIHTLSSNTYFEHSYDCVINFIVIKDGTIDANIEYIKSLIDFCKAHQVKKLIHFSSIMVYNYQLKDVNEATPIETVEETNKKGYGELKIAVDQYLLSIKETLPFELVLVRPGYVLGDNRACPFIKRLPGGISVIKGNKNSKQPVVRREDIHKALIRIIETENNNLVYHFFPNDGMTKFRYARQTVGGKIFILPKWLFKEIPGLLSSIGIIPKSLYSRFEGMYIESHFSSKETEDKLNFKFN